MHVLYYELNKILFECMNVVFLPQLHAQTPTSTIPTEISWVPSTLSRHILLHRCVDLESLSMHNALALWAHSMGR